MVFMKDVMVSKKLDAIVLHNLHEKPSANYLYYARSNVAGVVVIKKTSSVLYTWPMELERATKSANMPVKIFKNEFSKLKGKTVGVDFVNTSLALKKHLKGIKLVNISKELAQLRRSKTPEELKKIKKAISITEDIFLKTFFNFKNFKTEVDVASYMHKLTLDGGCELAYPVIVASGKNAAQAHYEPKNTTLKKGFCVIDFGVKFQGYCADITRTIYLGNPTKKDVENYFKVLQAHQDSVDSLKRTTKASTPDKVARETLGKLSKLFIHTLGHGLGLDVHEGVTLHENSKQNIQLGEVFTIEPGIYQEGNYGIRIEDDYVMTKTGPKRLSTLGQQLLIIK